MVTTAEYKALLTMNRDAKRTGDPAVEAIYRTGFLQTVALLHESGHYYFQIGRGDQYFAFYEELVEKFDKRKYDEVSKLLEEKIEKLTSKE